MRLFKASILGLAVMVLAGCTALDDTVTSFEADTKGLERTVEVYSMTGELLKTYEGKKVRTEVNAGGQLMLNVDGKRIQIVNTSVIIEQTGKGTEE